MNTKYTFPEFDDLPEIKGCPKGCLWGFYDIDDTKDEVGCAFHDLQLRLASKLGHQN
jgi:hypothetical protein